MPDYKVERVSQQPPREWAGPHGTVYYISAKLEGHPKPVSIGKKAPNALQPGMTISGDIIPDYEHGEDKWKNAPMGQGSFGGSPAGGASKPAYQPKDEAGIKAMWAIGQSVKLLKDGTSKLPSNQAIELWADTFYSMVERVKTGQRAADAPRTVVPMPPDSDEESQSLYNSIAGGVTADNTELPADW